MAYVAVMPMKALAHPKTRLTAIKHMYERIAALLVDAGVPKDAADAWVNKTAHLHQRGALGVMKVEPYEKEVVA